MEQRLLLVINPVSGDGAAKRWTYDMIEILSKKYPFITVFLSSGVNDIKNTVAANASKFDAIVCCGGDGTLNETLEGIVKSGADTKLGYLPMGTVNDFANSHGISKNLNITLSRIVEAVPREYDVGTLGERVFSYVAAFGAFTDVAYQTPQEAKSAFGKLAYISEAAKRLSSLRPIKMTFYADDRCMTDEFIYGMVSNSKTVGGIRFFDEKTDEFLCDGLIEVTLVKHLDDAVVLSKAVTALLNPKVEYEGVVKLKTSRISFSFDEKVPFTVDGEFGGEYTDVEASVIPRGIKIMA